MRVFTPILAAVVLLRNSPAQRSLARPAASKFLANLRAALALCGLAGIAFGQASDSAPAFLAADVHPSDPTRQYSRGPFFLGGRYEMRGATLVDLITKAYGVDADKVVGGPNWLEYDRFEVAAMAPPNTPLEAAKRMLQTLLADRFKLAIHKDIKPLPAYLLELGKGKPKLKEADGGGDTGCKFNLENRPADPGGGPSALTLNFACRNMTMAEFADGMRGLALAPQYIGTNPVLDKTGLEGKWNFDFKYSAPVLVLPGSPAAPQQTSLQDAIDKQLGLKLDLQTIDQPVIVVDRAERKPAPNAPDIAEAIPPLPTEFEVADLRPVDPASPPGMMLQIQPGGRVNLKGFPLKFYIQQAWNVQNDNIIDAPKWMDTDRYDIIAKAPGVAAPAPGTPGDNETVWVMLRALLEDRFKLKVHFEDRPATAYTLAAAKPKLKPTADPASRTKIVTAQAGGRGGSRAPTMTVTVQNMTMAQFAEQLSFIAPNYIRSPVLDATQIDGAYDFTLSFGIIPPRIMANLNGRGPDPNGPGDALAAAEPVGGVTLFEAIEKQLGLKLEAQKRPAPVLVIDHVERKPEDN